MSCPGRRRQSRQTPQRSKRLVIRLSEEEYDLIVREAASRNLSAAAYIVMAAVEHARTAPSGGPSTAASRVRPSVVVIASHRQHWDSPAVYGPFSDEAEAQAYADLKFRTGEFDPSGCAVEFAILEAPTGAE